MGERERKTVQALLYTCGGKFIDVFGGGAVKHELPRDTREALQHKVDPNMGERERKTVQALLYTCGGKFIDEP